MADKDNPTQHPRAAAVGIKQTKLSGTAGPKRLLGMRGPVVGIDLGTSNSCVAVVRNGEAEVIQDPSGHGTVPSIVLIDRDGDLLVGHPARERLILEPDRGVVGSKRFLGRPYASKEVKALGHFFNYELVEGPEGRVAAKVADRILPLEEVAGHVLEMLRQIAKHQLGEEVQRAVVTVPAYFGETQRQAVRDAGRFAGLYVERILNEPTAAAVAYGFGRGLNETVLVYDLGGGTLDTSVLRITGDRMEVLATDGDPFLGGSDFDDRLTEYALMLFERETSIPLRDQMVPVQRVRFAVETAKIQLSQATVATVNLPYITQNEAGDPVDLTMEIERDVLEDLTNDLVERTLTIVQRVLDAAQVKSSELDDVILVGGQSRSPAVRRMLLERFNRRPCSWVHPDEAVALGAARVADAISQAAPLELTDVLAASIRVGLRDGRSAVLIGRGARLPTEKRFEVTLSANAQGKTKVLLYRGEKDAAAENTLLGNLMLPGLAPTDGTNAKATIILSISADGLLAVRARHPSVGEIAELDVLLL